MNSNVESAQQPESPKDVKIADTNDRNVRSAKMCGSCQCTEKSSDEVELISCTIKDGLIEVSKIDYREIDFTKLLNKQAKKVDILIKDTMSETIKGLQSSAKIKQLILESNANLELKATGSLINLNMLQFRRQPVKNFEDEVFGTPKLIISNLMESSLTDFALKETWKKFSWQIQELVVEGECSQIGPFKNYRILENVTMLNVVSEQSDVLSGEFLQSAERLKTISFVNSSRISLPKHFLSGSGAQDVSFVLDADNIRQQTLDEKKGVKNLNGRSLSDSEKEILTSTSDSDKCKIFCVNDDCSREANELWKLNCVICIRNKVGADEDLEKRICDYKPTSDPSSTVSFFQIFLHRISKSNKIEVSCLLIYLSVIS